MIMDTTIATNKSCELCLPQELTVEMRPQPTVGIKLNDIILNAVHYCAPNYLVLPSFFSRHTSENLRQPKIHGRYSHIIVYRVGIDPNHGISDISLFNNTKLVISFNFLSNRRRLKWFYDN